MAKGPQVEQNIKFSFTETKIDILKNKNDSV